jgi:hypothetical protein
MNAFMDPNYDSYGTFFDFDWAKGIDRLTKGTRAYGLAFRLLVAWRFAANTHMLPCAICRERISNILDGEVCNQCGRPYHPRCGKPESHFI